MKPARILVLAVALAAGAGAVYLMGGKDEPPPVVDANQTVPMTDILVAAADLPLGQTLKAEDLRWQSWPDVALTPGYITRTSSPNGLADAAGSIIRTGFLANEPIRTEKLIKAGSGFMSAILPQGMRAIAIEITRGGANSAGGFILPNDRVDVIKTYREDGGNGELTSETLLSDIRVLAIGPVVQEKNGETVVTGETATIALSQAQAESVALAAKVGSLSLTLRSIQDAGRPVEANLETGTETALTVVRFGVAKQQPRR